MRRHRTWSGERSRWCSTIFQRRCRKMISISTCTWTACRSAVHARRRRSCKTTRLSSRDGERGGSWYRTTPPITKWCLKSTWTTWPSKLNRSSTMVSISASLETKSKQTIGARNRSLDCPPVANKKISPNRNYSQCQRWHWHRWTTSSRHHGWG